MSEKYQVKITEDNLHCPTCGENYMHHTYVKIYERFPYEDSPSVVLHVNGVKEGKFVTHEGPSNSRNPSMRRDGIRIGFWCEHCEHHIELTIAQHKGFTLMEFEVWPEGRISETLSANHYAD